MDTALIDALMYREKAISAIKQFNIVWKRISLRPYESFPRRLQDILLNGSMRARFLDTTEEDGPQPPTQRLTKAPIESTTQKPLELDTLQSSTSQTKRKRNFTEEAEPSDDDGGWKGKRGRARRPVPYLTRFKAKFEKKTLAEDSEDSNDEIPEIKDPVSGRTRSNKAKSQSNSAKDKARSKKKKNK